MLRWFADLLLLPGMLLPSGVCLCHCAGDPDRPVASGDSCLSAERGGHDLDHEDDDGPGLHGPRCLVLKAPAESYAPTQIQRLPQFTHLSHDPTARPVLRDAVPRLRVTTDESPPLYLALRTLRI
jgi:hypothetical protein